jgi:aminocarboxymuconate-semialdehyde decarboxylase
MIDLHCHTITPGMFDRHPHWGPWWENGTMKIGNWYLGAKKERGANLEDAIKRVRVSHEGLLGQMEERGISKLVLSQPAHMYMYWTGEFGTEYARIVNDELAAFCAARPDKFDWWALVPLGDPDAAPAELERAVTQLGAVGMMMGGTNLGGHELYDECYEPLWETLVELDVPSFVHGYNQSVAHDQSEDKFDLTSVLGMPYDETAGMWNLICGGVLDRYPELRFYVTHAGGFFPYHLGRFEQTNKTMAPDAVNERPVADYLVNFYFDPDVHDPIMRRALVEQIGVDRFVYGDNLGGADNFHGDLTDGIGLSDEDRESIRTGNALRLLKRLTPSTGSGASAGSAQPLPYPGG